MHVQFRVTLAAFKEIRSPPCFVEYAALVVSVEFDKFIGVHIDVE